MNFQTAVKTCFNKYIDFTGRASRSEYWWFALFCVVVNVIVALFNIDVLSTIVSLALILPSLAVLVRRLHDDDKSGWWALLLLIPVIGGLIILYFMVIPGTQGPNRFGNQPA